MNEQHEPVSSNLSVAIKILGIHRVALGAFCLIAPRFSCALFQFPVPAAYSIMPRLFGVRDLVLGELLLTAEDKNSSGGGKREIKRALWANIGTDCVDLASIAFGVATGTFGKTPALIFGGGAAASAVVGGLIMRSM